MPTSELTWLDFFGISVFVLGLAIEVIADAQKSAWNKKDKSGCSRGAQTWCCAGLWQWSRHPNYL